MLFIALPGHDLNCIRLLPLCVYFYSLGAVAIHAHNQLSRVSSNYMMRNWWITLLSPPILHPKNFLVSQ